MLPVSEALHEACNAALHDGLDFPEIWRSIISRHPLVAGLPVQALDGDTPVLDILLLTGQCLRFGHFGFILT